MQNVLRTFVEQIFRYPTSGTKLWRTAGLLLMLVMIRSFDSVQGSTSLVCGRIILSQELNRDSEFLSMFILLTQINNKKRHLTSILKLYDKSPLLVSIIYVLSTQALYDLYCQLSSTPHKPPCAGPRAHTIVPPQPLKLLPILRSLNRRLLRLGDFDFLSKCVAIYTIYKDCD